jgi:DNA sulfur modification protein DndE
MAPIERIQLSKAAKDKLVKLKRRRPGTGIKNWNVLCRWAFCTSLAEETVPSSARIPADSNVEMSWRTFGGTHHALYLALLQERCERDGLGTSDEVLASQFRLHLHRGIDYLAADKSIKSVTDLLRRGLAKSVA